MKCRHSNGADGQLTTVSLKLSKNNISIFSALNRIDEYCICWLDGLHQDPLKYYEIDTGQYSNIIDYLVHFINIETCKEYIRHSKAKYLFIIIGKVSNWRQTLEHLHEFAQIHSIFVFDDDEQEGRAIDNILLPKIPKVRYNKSMHWKLFFRRIS